MYESLFNFGSEERISNDKVSILKLCIVKLSRFLHFAIEGYNLLHSRSFKVVALASINDYPNLGHLLSTSAFNSSRLGNDTSIEKSSFQ